MSDYEDYEDFEDGDMVRGWTSGFIDGRLNLTCNDSNR